MANGPQGQQEQDKQQPATQLDLKNPDPVPRLRKRDVPARLGKFVWIRVQRALTRDLSARTLENLLREENATWQADTMEVKTLIFLFRVKHEELRTYVARENAFAGLTMFSGLVGLIAAVCVVAVGWSLIHGYVDMGKSIPWQMLAATSGAVLFIIAAATLLLRMSDRYAQRAVRYVADSDETRRTEAAVRLALYGLTLQAPEAQQALCGIAEKLLERKQYGNDVPLDVSAVPDVVRELAETTAKAAGVAAKKKD